MLHAENTGLFNPLVPKAHNSECQNLLYFLYKLIQQELTNWRTLIFCTLGTNGLIAEGLSRGFDFSSFFNKV